MAKEQRVFTKEFKQEAVRLAQTSGRSLTQLARELGISDSALYTWRKQLAEEGEQAFAGKGHQSELEEENRRLRREVEVLKQEREVLKKPFACLRRASHEVRLHCPLPAGLSNHLDVSGIGGVGEWLLRLAPA
jgi:transposase